MSRVLSPPAHLRIRQPKPAPAHPRARQLKDCRHALPRPPLPFGDQATVPYHHGLLSLSGTRPTYCATTISPFLGTRPTYRLTPYDRTRIRSLPRFLTHRSSRRSLPPLDRARHRLPLAFLTPNGLYGRLPTHRTSWADTNTWRIHIPLTSPPPSHPSVITGVIRPCDHRRSGLCLVRSPLPHVLPFPGFRTYL